MSTPYTRVSVIPSAKGTTGIRYIEYVGTDYTLINTSGLTAIDTYFVAVSTGKMVIQGGPSSWRMDLGSEYELVKLQFSFTVPAGVTIKCYSTTQGTGTDIGNAIASGTTVFSTTTTGSTITIDLRISPATIALPAAAQTDPYFTQSVRARYVRVENPGTTLTQSSSDVKLLFSQLAVYDIYNRNVATAKPTRTSDSASPTASSSAVISGVSNGSYTGSTAVPGAWWEVDLGKEYSLWKFQFTPASQPIRNIPIVFYNSQRQETARKLIVGKPSMEEYTIINRPSTLPSQIQATGLSLWLDASDINGTGVQPPVDQITTWVDKSGYGNNATKTYGANVSYIASVTGSVTGEVRFISNPNGPSYGGMVLPDGTWTSGSNSFTIFIVHKSAQPGLWTGTIFSADEGSATGNSIRLYCELPGRGGKLGFIPFNTTIDPGDMYTTTPITTSNKTVICVTYDSTTRVVKLYINGNTDISYTYINSVTTWSPTSHYIGQDRVYAQPLDGSIYEVIGYNTIALSTASRQSIETYLMNKWGVSSPRLIRYIKLYSIEKNLTFTQFAAVDSRGINVAVGKVTCGLFYNTTTTTTTADTTPTDSASYYYNPVNGRFDSRYLSSAAGTSIQNVVWWLDLGKAYSLNSIIFYNDLTNNTTAGNAPSYTLNAYDQNHTKVYTAPTALTTSYKQILDVRSTPSGPPADIVPVSGIGVKTRYIKLIKGTNTLKLGQIVAVDSLGRNVAFGRSWVSATSNSTNGAIATNNQSSSTNYDTLTSPATLDLGEEHEIIYIVVYGLQTTSITQPSESVNTQFDANLSNTSCLLLDGASNTVAIQPIFNFQVDLSGIVLDYTGPQSTLDTGSSSAGCIAHTISGALNQPLIIQGSTTGQYAFSADQFTLPNTFALTMQLGLNGTTGVGYLGLTSGKTASYTGGAGSPWSTLTSYLFKVNGLTAQAMVSGVAQGSETTITATSILQIIYDGVLIDFVIDGLVVYTSAYSTYTSFASLYFGAYFGTWNSNMTVSVFNTKSASVDITAAANDLAAITWTAAAEAAAACARLYDLRCDNTSSLTLVESTSSISNLKQNASNLVRDAGTQVNTTIPGYISTMQGYYDTKTANISTLNGYNTTYARYSTGLSYLKTYLDNLYTDGGGGYLKTLYDNTNGSLCVTGKYYPLTGGVDLGLLGRIPAWIKCNGGAVNSARRDFNTLTSIIDNLDPNKDGFVTENRLLAGIPLQRSNISTCLTNFNAVPKKIDVTGTETLYSDISTIITDSTALLNNTIKPALQNGETTSTSINTYITTTVAPLVTTYTNTSTTNQNPGTLNQLTAQQNYLAARTALATLRSTEISLNACLSTLKGTAYNIALLTYIGSNTGTVDTNGKTICNNLGLQSNCSDNTANSAYKKDTDITTKMNDASTTISNVTPYISTALASYTIVKNALNSDTQSALQYINGATAPTLSL